MLGKLIQGYGKGFSSLESSTEEEHTRTLLYPSTSHTRLNSYPTSSPTKSPTFRIGPFDDKGGLDLNETRDLRIIIAQDAFGVLDRPVILFDSHKTDNTTSPNPTSPSDIGKSSPRTSPNLQRHQVPFDVVKTISARNRSSTVSGISNPWTRTSKEPETNDRISQLLDCMFGVTSVAKSGSTTKMHVLISGQESSNSSKGHIIQTSPTTPQGSRVPLIRSKTSSNPVNTTTSASSSNKDPVVQQDLVLVTRMFSVPLPDSTDTQQIHGSSQPDVGISTYPSISNEGFPTAQSGTAKKHKLVEKKTPMFAIGLIFCLPNNSDLRVAPNAIRPPSRTSYAFSSLPSSYGSDMLSSWTLLDAIPESLSSSSQSERNHGDGRVELITEIWDVILRSLSTIEQLAQHEILRLLQQVNQDMINSATKAPKGPHEQRTNQRNVYIRQPWALGQVTVLHQGSKHILRRIGDALRIPRVTTGLGFVDGHWLDESRYLVQLCGTKNQNFFLFNLLTAFLGTHFEWLEQLNLDFLNKSSRLSKTTRKDIGILSSRTIIVSDRRDLGLFRSSHIMPNPEGSSFSSGTPQSVLNSRLHRASQGSQLHVENAENTGLSTSASSNGSIIVPSPVRKVPLRHHIDRKDSDTFSLRNAPTLAVQNDQESLRKTSTAELVVSPNPATPVAHFSTKQNSYFPEGAVAEGDDSIATAELTKQLQRTSSNLSYINNSNAGWGNLLSNVSGLWNKKQEQVSTATGKHSTATRNRSAKISSGPAESQSSESNKKVEKATTQVTTPYANSLPRPASQLSEANGTMVSSSVPISMKSNIQPPKLRVDQKDGVVDVDVNIPGFLSWSENDDPLSPGSFSYRSPSTRSLGGNVKMHGTTPHTYSSGDMFGARDSNVSGFLKRFHEDFSLQAVRPYPDLLDDIKRSMSQEPDPSTMRDSQQSDEDGKDPWVDICSTIVADTRTFNIQRLILRRKRPSISTNDIKETPNQSPEVRHVNTAGQKPLSGDEAPEQFSSEVIMDFDTTLVDAIEQVLNDADRLGRPSAVQYPTHSRTKSGSTISTSRSTPPSNLYMRNQRRSQIEARSDSHHVIMQALEEVVKTVHDDLLRHQNGRDIDERVTGVKSLKQNLKQENLLREGLRKWLVSCET